MKLLVRLAVAVLLLASAEAAFRALAEPEASSRPGIRQSVGLDALRKRRVLYFAVPEDSNAYFFHRGSPLGFEYDLLSGFASGLGVQLAPRVVSSLDEAVLLLRARVADVALLPREENPIDGARRADPYVGRNLLLDEAAHRTRLRHTALFVRDDSPELLASLNDYLGRSARDGTAKMLYERYFVYAGRFGRLTTDGTFVPKAEGISPYDRLIVKHAGRAGLDWRLVAAVIFEESTFDADAVSPRGARGLMQLMPSVAEEVGADDLIEPESNIRAGVRYLGRLARIFGASETDANLPIVLAAYVIGPGHVLDAQRIARATGLDPNVWRGGLEEVLPLLEEPTYFGRTRCGFARGRHAVDYVNRTLRRYGMYKLHFAPRQDEVASNARRGVAS